MADVHYSPKQERGKARWCPVHDEQHRGRLLSLIERGSIGEDDPARPFVLVARPRHTTDVAKATCGQCLGRLHAMLRERLKLPPDRMDMLTDGALHSALSVLLRGGVVGPDDDEPNLVTVTRALTSIMRDREKYRTKEAADA